MLDLSANKRFEVSVCRAGRWIIDCLAGSEQQARARADELYADESVEAVRVVRGRFGQDGTSFESVIHEQVREKRRGEAPIRIAASPSDEAWCETIEDFYGPSSRQAIARLLRNFLDRHAITPTELLHHHRYMRLLERQESLLPQALQRMAGAQARARGIDIRLRLDALNRFADEANSRAKDALASRAARQLGEGGLAALAEEIAAVASSPFDQKFYLRFGVSKAFEAVADATEKLTLVLGWTEKLPATLFPIVDELVSGLLGAAALIQDAVGPLSSLAGALETLAEIAQGRAADSMPAATAKIARLIGEARLPETALILVERITREIGSEKPLSRDGTDVQRRSFTNLLDRLTDQRGIFIGGPAMVTAIAARSRRLGIVGGVEAVAFKSEALPDRIDQILTLATGIVGERQQRALATYLTALLEGCDAAARAALQPRIAAARLPEPAKAALFARLGPAAASAA